MPRGSLAERPVASAGSTTPCGYSVLPRDPVVRPRRTFAAQSPAGRTRPRVEVRWPLPGAPLRSRLGGLLLRVDRPPELLLVHRRPALDAELLGLVVELLARPALRPVRPGALAAAPRGGHVLRRRGRGAPRLAGEGGLIVDRDSG